jgi:hypothetical protein
MAKQVALLPHQQNIPGWNLDVSYSEDCSGFLQPVQANARLVPPDMPHPHGLQFIIQ